MIKLEDNKVYTSYYGRACKEFPDFRLVSISLGVPERFGGEFVRELNPTPLLLKAYKAGEISDEEYSEIYYNEVLANLDAHKIYEKVKGKCMLCYCGAGKFCHRHLVLEWLVRGLGESIRGGEV